MKNNIRFIDLGNMKYNKFINLQNNIINNKILFKSKYPYNNDKDFIFFVEHEHIYTIGKKRSNTNLIKNYEKIKKKKINIVNTDRGGKITYHGPGQLIIYPILNLKHFICDLHKYIRKLEKWIIITLKKFNIINKYYKETGVWIYNYNIKDIKKICSIGIKCSNWITSHGIALNVNTNLKYFNYIIPCGIKKNITSMSKELNKNNISINEVKKELKNTFYDVF